MHPIAGLVMIARQGVGSRGCWSLTVTDGLPCSIISNSAAFTPTCCRGSSRNQRLNPIVQSRPGTAYSTKTQRHPNCASSSSPVIASPSEEPTDIKLASEPLARPRRVLGSQRAQELVAQGNSPDCAAPSANCEARSVAKPLASPTSAVANDQSRQYTESARREPICDAS